MKMKIATAIFSLAAVAGFTEEVLLNTPAAEVQINQPSAALPVADLKISTNPALKKSFSYFRMGIADPDAINSLQALPEIGLGYRYGLFQSAIDVTASYTRDAKKGDHETFSYTAPRVSYLRYVSSDLSTQSFYYGAGLGWGAVMKGNVDDFQGISANATVGYEMNRNQSFHSFIQLDVTQGAMAISTTSYSFARSWTPLAEVSVGLGF